MTISVAQKSAEAFRTISEVAETLKLPQHVLRFWETRFTQIKPLKRAGGRRFYRPEDVELLGAIRQLLYGEGYTIKGVQRILREQGPRAVALLARNRDRPPPEAEADETAEDDAPPFEPATPLGAPPAAEPSAAEGDPFARLRAVLDELDACRGLLVAARGPARTG